MTHYEKSEEKYCKFKKIVLTFKIFQFLVIKSLDPDPAKKSQVNLVLCDQKY